MTETEELAEIDPGEPGEVFQMWDESENGKSKAKILDTSKQEESSFEEVDLVEMEEFAENNPGDPGGNTDNTE